MWHSFNKGARLLGRLHVAGRACLCGIQLEKEPASRTCVSLSHPLAFEAWDLLQAKLLASCAQGASCLCCVQPAHGLPASRCEPALLTKGCRPRHVAGNAGAGLHAARMKCPSIISFKPAFCPCRSCCPRCARTWRACPCQLTRCSMRSSRPQQAVQPPPPPQQKQQQAVGSPPQPPSRQLQLRRRRPRRRRPQSRRSKKRQTAPCRRRSQQRPCRG